MTPLKILWFEDNIKDFSKIIPALIEHGKMSNRAVEFEPYEFYPDDFDVKMFDGMHSVAFIDLNLKNGQKGIEIIEMLKAKGTYMEILLYSNNPLDLERHTEGANYVEGVYRHATLEGIEQKMKDMIDTVNYKEQMVLARHGY